MRTFLGSKMSYINHKPAPTKSTETISDYAVVSGMPARLQSIQKNDPWRLDNKKTDGFRSLWANP